MAQNLKSLESLFVEELQDLYDAEKQITSALPKMAKAANSKELKQGFEEHLEQTKEQISRLEQIFDELEEKPTGKKCVGMEGLIKEGEKLIEEKNADPDARDAGLIAAAQKVEHYEIAGYGTARTYAEQLGKDHFADLLQTTLDEEYQTDEKLTSMAVERINWQAMK